MVRGAVVLCGGRSTRMGRDKATLPFGPEVMLQRVVRLLSEVTGMTQIVVVAARDQVLPPLPADILVAHDERPERGPLEGLAAGLRLHSATTNAQTNLERKVDAVYATSCDVPLLETRFVERMFESLGDHDIAVPRDGDFHHPLAAVYRLRVLDRIESLLQADRLRPRFLFDECHTREVAVDELRTVDPELTTLLNLNHPDEYVLALRKAGLEYEESR